MVRNCTHARHMTWLPGSGLRFEGCQPAMRASSTTQLRMSGGNGFPRSAGGSSRSARTTVPITCRSSSVSTSSAGVSGASRA